MNVKGIYYKVLLKQGTPNAKPDFRSAVQKDFKHGFVQPFRFCHVKWIKLRGKKLCSGKEKSFCSKRSLISMIKANQIYKEFEI